MSKFSDKVIEIVKTVPYGRVVSYGQVALMAGVPRAARQVGWVLHSRGDTPDVPWWRVINNAGRISTKCPEHTPLTQKGLLESEGVLVGKNLSIDIKKYRYLADDKYLEKISLDPEYIYLLHSKYRV